MNAPKCYAVILAAGSSSRMHTKVPKQRLLLAGKSVLLRSVLAFSSLPEISGIVLVCREEDLSFAKSECREIEKNIIFAIGGDNRMASAKNGFSALPSDAEYVAIHDAARCLVTPSSIISCYNRAVETGAATIVASIVDTVKEIDREGIRKTCNRENLKLAQTPQIFRCDWYREALDFVESHHIRVTDDNEMLEALGKKVHYVENEDENMKITTQKDLLLAEAVLKVRNENG